MFEQLVVFYLRIKSQILLIIMTITCDKNLNIQRFMQATLDLMRQRKIIKNFHEFLINLNYKMQIFDLYLKI
jgi:hypothetical protein